MIFFAFPAVTAVAQAARGATACSAPPSTCPARGGSALLYQHLFWFWGHPEVYILFLPATGMVSMIIPVFSRRAAQRLHLDRRVAASRSHSSASACGCTTCSRPAFPRRPWAFFSAASLVIALPERQCMYFAWIATMWGGKVTLDTADALRARLPGHLPASAASPVSWSRRCPSTWQVTDSYFIVAHFHYVLNGAVVFPIFGAIYFWYPKMTGRMLSERLGRWSFWTMFVGFNVTFFPMHILGLLGHAAARLHLRRRARMVDAEPDREHRLRGVRGWHAPVALGT